jgi:hypothetical protein
MRNRSDKECLTTKSVCRKQVLSLTYFLYPHDAQNTVNIEHHSQTSITGAFPSFIITFISVAFASTSSSNSVTGGSLSQQQFGWQVDQLIE